MRNCAKLKNLLTHSNTVGS